MKHNKTIWAVSLGSVLLALVLGCIWQNKNTVYAGDIVKITAEMSTLTFEETDYDVSLKPEDLFVSATDSNGNDRTDSLAISKIVKKNVKIDRTSGYGTKTYNTVDVTSTYSNADVIEDANGIYEITYKSGSVSKTVTVQAGDFLAPLVYAADANQNPSASVGVAPNTQITFNSNGIAGYTKTTDTTSSSFTAFDIWKSGKKTQSNLTSGSITVGSGENYTIVATATDKKGNATVFGVEFYDQYAIIVDFEDSPKVDWNNYNTILVQGYSSKQITSTSDSKKLQIVNNAQSWSSTITSDGKNYKGINIIYGMGLFDLPMTNNHEYKEKVEVTINAEFVEGVEKQASTVFIGHNSSKTAFTLNSDGTYSGIVELSKAPLFGLSSDASPYNCPYGIYNGIFFDPSVIAGATITIDNVELIPLVSDGNAIVSSVETKTKRVALSEEFSLASDAYGLVATDFRGLPVKTIDLTVLKVEANGESEVDVTGRTTLSSDVAAYYKLVYTITDYYGNTATETVNVYVGDIEFDAPVITVVDENLSLAGGTKIAFGAEANKYFSVQDASAYTLKYTVLQNGTTVATDVDTYDITITKGDRYEVVITATDVSGNCASKTIVLKYAGVFVQDFEERNVGELTQWDDENTILVQTNGACDAMKIIEKDGSKKLQVTASSGVWQSPHLTNYKGVDFVYGLGVFEHPMIKPTTTYSATVELTIQATFADGVDVQSSKAYIGRPDASFTEFTLNADGTYSGIVELEKVPIFGLSDATTPWNCPYAVYNRVLIDSTLFSSVTITIDNFTLFLDELSREQNLTTGSSLTFDGTGVAAGINAANYETFTYTVEKNNVQVAKDVASYTIESMGATDYYEVWANATDKYGNVESKYMLYAGESVNMTTFSTLTTSMLKTAEGYLSHYNSGDIKAIGTEGAAAVKEIYTDESGNQKLRLTIKESAGLKTGITALYLPHQKFNIGKVLDTTITSNDHTQYSTYMDITIKAKLIDGKSVPSGWLSQGVEVPFSLTATADGYYSYSGTVKNWEYGFSKSSPLGFYSKILFSDCTVIKELVVEIDNIRWEDLR